MSQQWAETQSSEIIGDGGKDGPKHWSLEETDGVLLAHIEVFKTVSPNSNVYHDAAVRKQRAAQYYPEVMRREYGYSGRQRSSANLDSMLTKINTAFQAWKAKQTKPASVSDKLWKSLPHLQPHYNELQRYFSKGVSTVNSATTMQQRGDQAPRAPPGSAAASTFRLYSSTAAGNTPQRQSVVDPDTPAIEGEAEGEEREAVSETRSDGDDEDRGEDAMEDRDAFAPVPDNPALARRIAKVTSRDLVARKKARTSATLARSVRSALTNQTANHSELLMAMLQAREETNAHLRQLVQLEQKRLDQLMETAKKEDAYRLACLCPPNERKRMYTQLLAPPSVYANSSYAEEDRTQESNT